MAIVAGAMALGGCTELRQAIGAEKSSPDEFQIRVRKPLSMPREYGLRAPRPGAARPQDGRSQARQIVLDSDKSRRGARRVRPQIKGVSREEAALIAKLGGGSVDSGIRLKVDRESAQIVEDNKSFVDAIMFWKDQVKPGKVVDPKSEARRIQENVALGRRGDAGNVPTIERKKKGLFSQNIFADWF
ncbi:MAG: DUF3035 domain-containing protein [Alphaproteobacteria bacterium]|nr:DUF3035 domain-containing protein [Alphaproteobacteria bacterium]MCZ6496144.1 DUF3035 domain-containing protein [Alphaproteobacteria bacterium]